MHSFYDQNAPKKATNLSINSDLLSKSREMNVNLSATLENALATLVAKANSDKWASENKPAIRAYNEFVAENGCFGDEYRSF